ncbi:MAG: 50S ribosomal protein L14e [Candidatus Thorarchaeota archaeon]|nr:MAG: 50S ribosomal protein L14e [Candidatus Thorarchaeota archaeon]
MSPLEIGSICIKTFGREKGKRCIIVDLIDKNFVLVTGPPTATGVKRRRANIRHLEQTTDKINIKKGSTDEEVAQFLEKSKIQTSKPKSEAKRKHTQGEGKEPKNTV